MTGFTSFPVSTKSPVMAAFPSPVGWKLIAVANPMRPDRSDRHFILDNRVPARHTKLIDATVRLAFGADDLIELRGIEIDSWRRAGCGWCRKRRFACRQGFANDVSHFRGIAVAADMHVEGRGIGAQQMIVNGGNLDAAFDQLGHYGIDFGFEEDEIAHCHRAVMHRLEGDPSAQGQGWLDGDAIERYRKIGAGKAVTMNVARYAGFLSNAASTFCQSICWALAEADTKTAPQPKTVVIHACQPPRWAYRPLCPQIFVSSLNRPSEFFQRIAAMNVST